MEVLKVKENLSLIVLYILGFLLVITLVFMVFPIIVFSPIVVAGFFGVIVNNFINPLFNLLTPLGAIMILVMVIAGILMFIIKRETSRAAACYLPGIGAVCAVMEYTRLEQDEYVKFHTIQGLVLFSVTSIIFIIGMALINTGGLMAIIGYYLLSFLFIGGGLLLIYLMYTASTGKRIHLIPQSKKQTAAET
jgi:uncharacterized membrane protein